MAEKPKSDRRTVKTVRKPLPKDKPVTVIRMPREAVKKTFSDEMQESFKNGH